MHYDSEAQIVNEALLAAKNAAEAYIAKNGEPSYCGFAWVKIRPGNSRMAKYLKAVNLGSASYSGGVDVWNPSKNVTQSMDVKEAGAMAFADVLKKHGYKATPMSRAD